MGQRHEHEIFERLDVITYGIPSKRELRMTYNDYQPFGSFYSHYRHQRRTWLCDFPWPWKFRNKPLADSLGEAERVAEQIRKAKIPDDFYPLVDAMIQLAPSLVDDSDGWQRFKTTIQEIRELFEREEPTLRQFSDDDSGRASFLSRLHIVRKAVHHENTFQRDLLSVLFTFARSVGARKNWKRPFNNWEHGVRAAQEFEFDYFSWTFRECLIEARYQMICLGRNLPDKAKGRINRTQIKNRASIIYTVAHLKGEKPLPSKLTKQIRECRKEHNWEAYLNKLPKRAFPKKPCA